MHVYCTTVSRGVSQGAHGALYKINLNTNEVVNLLSYDDEIDYSGRGGDRGLRGLILYNNFLYVACASSILKISLNGEIVAKIEHKNLGFLHDMQLTESGFLVVSTKYDCVMEYSFITNSWVKCYHVNEHRQVVEKEADANLDCKNIWHLNSINSLYVSGLRTNGAIHIHTNKFIDAPLGIHNWDHGYYNDTVNNILKCGNNSVPVDDGTFLRGLSYSGNYIVVGQCPAKIIVFDSNLTRYKSININFNQNSSVQSLLITN